MTSKDFNSHTPHGVRLYGYVRKCCRAENFNSHTPHGVRLRVGHSPYYSVVDFNSHTPHGVRPDHWGCATDSINFNSHTPHGVRRIFVNSIWIIYRFQLTHPTRGATINFISYIRLPQISTHTPHTGCDTISAPSAPPQLVISTHTPHTGCDLPL